MSLNEEDTAFVDASVNDDDAVFIDRDDISNYNPGQILPESPEHIRKIRSWLQPTSYNDVGGEYRKHLASHLSGTGAWLTSSDVYQEWLQGDGDGEGLLWIKGIPGSGKSVMAAKLIDELARSNPGYPVLFFFFRQIIEANHKPQALLRDWMDQLLEYSPPLQKQLMTYVKANRPVDTVSMEDMWKDLRVALAGLPGKAFCVADALDEMDQGHGMDTFLKELASIGQWRPGAVKVLMTSRPVPIVERPLRMAPCLHLRLQESLVDVDISTYVEYTLSTCDSPIQASDKQLIRDAVPGRANGLFLYAKLAMDAFLQPGADIDQVLLHLPVDLNALYNNLLEEHARSSNVPAEIQCLILQAITHTARPLRLLELATMVQCVSPDGPDGSKRDLKATKGLIRAACGPLLEILPDETVSVIHHSFTEFLKGITRSDDGCSGYPILQLGSAHSKLALACLRYLQTGCLDGVNTVIKQRRGFDGWAYMSSWNPGDDCYSNLIPEPDVQMRLQYPFVEYAVGYWYYHVNRSEAGGHDQTELNSEIGKFLGDGKAMKAWLQLSWSYYSGEGRITQLHIAARAGLVSYAEELLGSMEVDVRDALGKTPIWWAATEGHEEVIRVLIAAGANSDQGELQSGFRPLHQAAIRNHYAAVKVLLEAGADPLPPKPNRDRGPANPYSRSIDHAYAGDSPLKAACLNGCLETLDVLLSYIQDINLTQRALAWAARGGQSKVVTSLLQRPGVDVNLKVDGATPIYLACKAYSVATVEILLQAGADPSIRCENHLNCLHRICHVGASHIPNYADADVVSKIFSLLIQHGIDVNDRTPSDMTALHGAVAGSSALTQLLVDAGADANAKDHGGATPLYMMRGHADTFRTPVDPMMILIEQGRADINNIRADGDTVLHWMLGELPAQRVLKFLEYGPECNLLDRRGNAPLHKALARYAGSPAVIEGLLKAGADPNMKNRDGLAPLLCLRGDDDCSKKLADILLGAGADLNTVDRDGKALLFRMLPTGRLLWHDEEALEKIRDLVKRGASMSIRDFKGRTILHEIVQTMSHLATRYWMPSKQDFDILADLGLDVKAVDHAGNGLLHELASREDNHGCGSDLVPLWEYLVAMGLDLEQKNNAGRTPLHILCANDGHPPRFIRKITMPIDLLISRAKNLDGTDNHGITPLHIAATRGELYTKKLLDAGADPTACTREGLTALHLASRCGQSNVVGILLAALRRETPAAASNPSQTGESGGRLMRNPVKGVNAKAYGRDEITSLFYACRSGRPETVALLIQAGADVRTGTVLQACVGFEGEGHLWKLSQGSGNGGQGNEDGRLLLDNPRLVIPGKRRHREPQSPDLDLSTNETSRIEEILEMLVTSGADLSQLGRCGNADGLIDQAVASGRDYTARCLREVRDKYLSGLVTANQESTATTLSGIMHHFLKEASVQTLNVSGLVERGAANQELFCYFLRRREYHLVEELARLGADFLRVPSDKQLCNLAILVRGGLSSLVEKVGDLLVVESRLNKADWHAFGDDTRPGLWFAKRDILDPKDVPVPFLLEAVQRELPNLDMMRLLVEKFRVDINELRFSLGSVRIPRGMRHTLVPKDSALHYAARGYSWWHAHQAVPYLLKAGADINLRSYNEDTPLHMALWGPGHPDRPGPFAKDAARILVENGADVNAVGNEGRSCLACAADDVDMIRLLVSHGAIVTAEAMFAAINAKNVAGVKELLSLGANASMRPGKLHEGEFDAEGRRIRPHSYGVTRLTGVPLHHEVFPLYHAGMAPSLRWWRDPGDFAEELEFDVQIVQVLLDQGADPFARFLSRINEQWEASSISDTAKDTPSLEVPEAHRECTILHELLLAGSLVDPFLSLPGLDVNHRDAKGRTLLLAACEGSQGPDVELSSHEKEADRDGHVTMFQRLISLGAELTARDNSGRNVLHHMISGNDFETTFHAFKDSLASVLREGPDLIHQTDDGGQTPLHYAVSRADTSRDTRAAQALLSAGADPLVVDKNGNSLLHVLAKSLVAPAQLDLFQDLARRGADINGRNKGGKTPLFIFCKHDKSKPKGVHNDEWKDVSDKDALLMLHELGADFFTRDAKGRGLLHAAARKNAKCFKELMDAGLDAMLEDEAQQTAIDVAALSGNQKVLQLFEKNCRK
ncbi:putative ankyrin repeat protein [Dactylonectria macrodidyma]|uniref:Ankyrin repeat protein n=1 Tax=Dactylonectria macrodidyma TaxID=307937 RepID=A0A9P9DW60_9HYPO|nr:putative ankyrin repeat protein [Dactylonectria macrodidyma]